LSKEKDSRRTTLDFKS